MGIIRDLLSQFGLEEKKDATGHDHGADGKFSSGSSSKSDAELRKTRAGKRELSKRRLDAYDRKKTWSDHMNKEDDEISKKMSQLTPDQIKKLKSDD